MTLRESIEAARLTGPAAGQGDCAIFEFRFGADNPVFAGHFPGKPVLPGIFQVEMARLGAEWTLRASLGVRAISKVKFLRPILPAENVRMELSCAEEGGLVRARANFSVDGQKAGETTLRLWRSE